MSKQLPLFSQGWTKITEALPEEKKEKAISELKTLVIEYFKVRTIKEKDNEK